MVIPTDDDDDTPGDVENEDVVDESIGDGPSAVRENSDDVDDAMTKADEFTVGADSEGNVIPHTNQVDDYRFRPHELNQLCVWDFCAQVDKV